jgi:hypothetical protein
MNFFTVLKAPAGIIRLVFDLGIIIYYLIFYVFPQTKLNVTLAFYIFYLYFGSILSCKYFCITFVPPVRIFCLIVFKGFPYNCILTKDLKKPISAGKSGRLLFAKSKVFSFFNFIISFDMVFILLSESTKAVKLGHRSKYEN